MGYFLAATTPGGKLIEVFIEVLTAVFQGIGEGFVDLWNTLILDSTGGLTTFAVWGIAMLSLGFAISIVYAILRKIG